MGEEFGKAATSFTYRYNQRNPTINASFGVSHAAENWMMFKGTNTGYVLCVLIRCSLPDYSTYIHMPASMDRLLSLK